MQDTRTPVKYAATAVAVGIGLGAALMFWMDGAGLGARAATGLALGGAAGAWLNLTLLSRGLSKRGVSDLWAGNARFIARVAVATLLAAAVSWPVRTWADGLFGGLAYIAVAGAGPLRRTPAA